jgi:hypothetical protein
MQSAQKISDNNYLKKLFRQLRVIAVCAWQIAITSTLP